MHFVGLVIDDLDNMSYYDATVEPEVRIVKTKKELIDYVIEERTKTIERFAKNVLELKDPDGFYQKWLNENPPLNRRKAGKFIKEEYDGELDDEGNLVEYEYLTDPQWDWWEIGGRWPDYLILKEKDENGSPKTCHEAKVKDIDWQAMYKKYPPYFILNESDWIDIENNWEDTAVDVIEELDQESTVFVVDCHI